MEGNENIFMAVNDSIAQMNFGAAILATLFAYDGWILLAALGGEMKTLRNCFLERWQAEF